MATETNVFVPARPQGTTTPVLAAALSNTVVQVSAQAGSVLESVSAYNGAAAAPVYIQVFDALAPNVTLGATKPKYILPMGQASALNLSDLRMLFAIGIAVAATTTATGSSAPGTAPDAAFSYR